MYQLNGEDVLYVWLTEHTSDEQKALFDWLPKLAADPRGIAGAERDGHRAVLYTAPVPDTDAFVDYIVVDQFKTVLIKAITDVDL